MDRLKELKEAKVAAQEEIKEGLNGLKDFRTYVVELIEKLNYEIETFK